MMRAVPTMPATGPDPAERLLAEVAARLHGPRARRADLLAELRDGLDDATEAAVAGGAEPAEARSRISREFGDSTRLAAELQEELAVHAARRSVRVVAVVAPGLELAWSLLYPRLAAPVAARHPEIVGRPWMAQLEGLSTLTLAALAMLCLAALGVPRLARPASRAAGVVTALLVLTISSTSAVMLSDDGGITLVTLGSSPAGLTLGLCSLAGLVVMSVAACRALRTACASVLNVTSSATGRTLARGGGY
jgi:hypothetical protein